MDTLTLALAHEALTSRSIRQAARQMHRSPSTVSTALARLESEIATPLLIRQDNGHLVLTVEAERRFASIAGTARHIKSLLDAVQWEGEKTPALSIDCLSRFSTIAHAGSIRSAARTLSIGQPQLARQMADMERRLNRTLLVRSSNGTELTATGHLVLASAEAIVLGWREISRAANERFKRDIRTWHVGTVMPLGHESGISAMLADLVVQWAPHQTRHPLRITSDTADGLLTGLKARQYDVIVLDHGHIPSDFDSAIISSTPFALVGQKEIMGGVTDIGALLRQYPLALPSRKSGIRQEAMRFIDSMTGDSTANAIDILEIDSIPVIINLVARYGYLSILPQASILRLPFALAHVSLAPAYMQTLTMAWRRNGMTAPLVEAIRKASLKATPPSEA